MIKSFLLVAALVVLCFSPLCFGNAFPDGWYDSYGDISWEKEILHLDNFAIDLRKYPNYSGYVAVYSRKKDSAESVNSRVARIKSYLICNGQIDESRVIVIDAGRKDEPWTILQPVDKDKPPPDFNL